MSSSGIGAVTTQAIGGVSVKRHVLDLETGHMMHITRRIGRRLTKWLRETPELVPGFRAIWEEGHVSLHPMLHPDGSPVMVPSLPDEMFRESYKLYASTLLGLLREQRERAKLTSKNGALPISDEDYQAGIRELVAESIRSMPEAELRELLAAREQAAIEVQP